MSMRGVLRLAEVQMRVLDMADSKQHYGTRMGLHEMMTDDDGLVYFKAWAEHDHHSLVLRETDQAGLDHIAFKVYDDATLDDLEKKISVSLHTVNEWLCNGRLVQPSRSNTICCELLL